MRLRPFFIFTSSDTKNPKLLLVAWYNIFCIFAILYSCVYEKSKFTGIRIVDGLLFVCATRS